MELFSRKHLIQIKMIKRQFQQNLQNFFVDFRIPIYCLIITAALDAISTHHFMSLAGAHVEIHPYIRMLSLHFGIVWGPIIGKVTQVTLGMVVIIYLRQYAMIILWLACFFYFLAFWFNLYVTAVRYGM
jgi:hypothetical protein